MGIVRAADRKLLGMDGNPSNPPPPPLPPAPPPVTTQTPTAIQAAADTGKAASAARGFASTILTSPQGLTDQANTTKKTLTGQ